MHPHSDTLFFSGTLWTLLFGPRFLFKIRENQKTCFISPTGGGEFRHCCRKQWRVLAVCPLFAFSFRSVRFKPRSRERERRTRVVTLGRLRFSGGFREEALGADSLLRPLSARKEPRVSRAVRRYAADNYYTRELVGFASLQDLECVRRRLSLSLPLPRDSSNAFFEKHAAGEVTLSKKSMPEVCVSE